MLKRVLKFSKRPLVWDTIKTTFWSTIGKGIGFLIPFFIATWFGVSSETDAFFFAYGIILFLSGIFAPVVESVIVPYVAEARINNEDVGRFIGNTLCISGTGLFILTILVLLIINPILSLITKFDDKTLRLVYLIFVETSPLIILLVWTSVLSGALNTYKKFTFPAISPAIRAAFNLIFIFAFKDSYGVHSIAFGYVMGEVVRLLFLWIVVKRLNLFKLCLCFQFNQKLLGFFKTASYQVIGMVAIGFNPVVNQTMASWLGDGGVSILCYSENLFLIPANLLIIGLLTTTLSHWSEKYYTGRYKEFQSSVYYISKQTVLVSVLATLLLLLIKNYVVNLTYNHGNFSAEKISMIERMLTFYLIGMTFHFLHHIFTRAFIVQKKLKIIFVVASIMCVSNIVFNLLLTRLFGIVGIAFTTTLIYGLSSLILVIAFIKNTKNNFTVV